MANTVNLTNASFTAKPPPVKNSFYIEICTNNLLHEPYS